MGCELCEQPGGQIIWQGARCRVVLVDDPLYAGFCRVIWNSHVAEMTGLTPADRQHFMDVVFAVEDVLRQTVAPDKINLASLGNVVPHLHWHVIPRFRDDACFPAPIWATPAREGRRRAPPASLAATLQARLESFT